MNNDPVYFQPANSQLGFPQRDFMGTVELQAIRRKNHFKTLSLSSFVISINSFL